MSLAISNIPKGTVFLLIFAIRNIVLFALHFVPLRSRSSNGTNLMTITISSNLAAKILVKMIKPTKPQQIEGRRKLLRLRIIATKTIKETQVMDEKKTLPMNDVNEIIARATLDDERDLWVSRKRKPEPFDLPGIMDLLNFKDLSFDNHEYREKMADIVSVSANEPLYEVRINERYRPKVVFTSKLKYYVALSDSVVNQSMNEVFALLEKMRKAGDNVQERKNQTENAIRLILARIKHFLDAFDIDKRDYDWIKDVNWKNIISSNPDLDGNRNFKEMIAFYHYIAAQIFRYELELNSRYGYNVSLNDIAIFYTEDLHIPTDTGIIDIVSAEDYHKIAAELEKKRKKESFFIDDDDKYDMAAALAQKLCTECQFISKMDKESFRKLLLGEKCNKPIHWPREKKSLLGCLWQDMRAITIDKEGQRILVPVGERGKIGEKDRLVKVKNNADPWADVVDKSFVDEHGKPFIGLRNDRHAKKDQDILDDLLSVFGITQENTRNKFR